MSIKRIIALFVVVSALNLSGCATYNQANSLDPNDPIQGVNRTIFAFNDTVDQVLFKPIAMGYNAIVPQPIDTAVTNFFSNLQDIDSSVNNLFQGKFDLFANDLGRVAINSTIGIVYKKPIEACPLNLAPTSSTTVTLAIGDCIAISLLELKGFKSANFKNYHPGGNLGKDLKNITEIVLPLR